jgi:ArsR family transcriptional regulator, arsenate/arsenite/antimonite-responsive transcriptional repressor
MAMHIYIPFMYSLIPDNLFASLSNDTRLRCLMLLLRHDELCVCELTHALAISQPHVSRHLALLRESGLVADRRAGLWVYYRINPELPTWVTNVLREILGGVGELSPYAEDVRLLEAMPDRPDAPRCA